MCYNTRNGGINMANLLLFGTPEIVTVSVFGALFVGFIIYLIFVPMKSWFTALFGGAYIPTFKLLAMKNRQIDVGKVVGAYILSKKSKLGIKLSQIESFVQSGGDIMEVLTALNFAKDAGIALSFDLACAIDRANHNVVECVQNHLNSKVIAVDDIRGFTKDEYEIITAARVSVKLDLANYVNGLGEEDLKSTVNAWVLENISHCPNHKNILNDPNKTLLGNFDLHIVGQKSMYDILDASICKVEVGRNLNMEKQIQEAEKAKVYAQIEAERMKNAEEVKELQMRTKTEEVKAEMLQAEAEVPKALSQAIKEGRFSVMDYYKLMNLQADTALRRSIIANEQNQKAESDFSFNDDEGDLFE